jgi:acyl-coenzyme A synthetase/AMP-(fatty) acid ligase
VTGVQTCALPISYKYPRRIRLVKELPKSQTGKVLRKILREKVM